MLLRSLHFICLDGRDGLLARLDLEGLLILDDLLGRDFRLGRDGPPELWVVKNAYAPFL